MNADEIREEVRLYYLLCADDDRATSDAEIDRVNDMVDGMNDKEILFDFNEIRETQWGESK